MRKRNFVFHLGITILNISALVFFVLRLIFLTDPIEGIFDIVAIPLLIGSSFFALKWLREEKQELNSEQINIP